VLGIPVAPADVHLIPYFTYNEEQRSITPWLYVTCPEVAQARRLPSLQEGSDKYLKVRVL
jgi:hypothetical protein